MDKDIAAVDDKGLVERLRVPLVIEYAVPVPVHETLQRAADEREHAASRLTVLREALDEIANASWPSVDGDDPVKRIQALARKALSGE